MEEKKKKKKKEKKRESGFPFLQLLPCCPHPSLQEFITAFTPCFTVLRAATWNYQQLRFIFDEKKLDSVALSRLFCFLF